MFESHHFDPKELTGRNRSNFSFTNGVTRFENTLLFVAREGSNSSSLWKEIAVFNGLIQLFYPFPKENSLNNDYLFRYSFLRLRQGYNNA
jgi:hypothetical protein